MVDSVSNDNTTTYNSRPATPASNPDSLDANPPSDPDLRRVVEAWPTLPEAVKTGIMAMVNVGWQATDYGGTGDTKRG